MTTTEIVLCILVALALVEVAIVFAGLGRATREIRELHAAIEAANPGPPERWPRVLYPAEWVVDEKAGPLALCQAHLDLHDIERGASFVPLEPARAGSQCAACLREATIHKARAA